MTITLSIFAHVADPTWDHPTIAYERGFSDATRGLDKRKQTSKQWQSYAGGYRDGLAWRKSADPMRFGKDS
jgi:hypothetical protein